MTRRTVKKIILLTLIFIASCSQKKNPQFSSLVNTAHLDHLYQTIYLHDKEMAIIHIYCEYPDYQWRDAPDEGIACVDDIARATLVYLEQYKSTGDTLYWRKVKNLVSFLMFMQADNGWFYNFIQSDYNINKNFKTSTALPSWWTWRALWALSEVALFTEHNDQEYTKELIACMEQSVRQINKHEIDTTRTKVVAGLTLPTWLPYETGADQAAVLCLFLNNYYKLTKQSSDLMVLKKISAGIRIMQQGDENNFPHYAFMSWENTWHGWGNPQSYALLKISGLWDDPGILTAALREINYFYPYLQARNFLSGFTLQKNNETPEPVDVLQFPQIAYLIRPMVYSCLEAYQLTNTIRYAEQAAQAASWFFGNNPAGISMYDLRTGRCFDGIINTQKINKNSGAESTIEALMVMIKIEQNPAAQNFLHRYILNQSTR